MKTYLTKLVQFLKTLYIRKPASKKMMNDIEIKWWMGEELFTDQNHALQKP